MLLFNLPELPVELVTEIMARAPDTEILNAGLAYFKLAPIAARLLPRLRSLKIGITDEQLKGSINSEHADLHLPPVLSAEIERILDILLPKMTESVESLRLENEMLRDEISDELFAKFLIMAQNAPLRELTFLDVDMERIQMWTLALLSRFQLEKIEMEECRFGSDAEKNLLKALESSFHTLTQIDLKGTREITDQFASRVRMCPHLCYFRISDCPRVTTFSAFQLIESAVNRRVDRLDVHMDNTDFDANRLGHFLKLPSREWQLEPITVALGYTKTAMLASHSSRKIVMIFV